MLVKKLQLSLESHLLDVPYERVNNICFKDQNGQDGVVMFRRFRSLENMRSYLHQRAKECNIFVKELWKYDFGECPCGCGKSGIWYWLRCAFRI